MSTKPSRIELDKEAGITIQVLNGARTQTITVDGNKITMEVKGPLGVSTIVQDDNSVSVQCNEFVVDSKTIRCTAMMSALLESGPSTLELSPAQAALTAPIISMAGEGEVNLEAPSVQVTAAADITVTAAGVVAVTGGNVNIIGATGTEMEAPLMTFIGIPDFE